MHKPASSGPILTGNSAPWDAVLSLGMKREYRVNTPLLHPGEKNDYLYYVKKGEVLVSHFASPESISRLFIIRDSAMLGLIGFFTPVVPLASWLTLRPCTCYLFSRECVNERIPRELLLNLLEQLAFMSSFMTRRFAQGMIKRHEVRLARLLIHLIDACPAQSSSRSPGITVIPSVTQEMASELLGMHPVTLNKILSAFRNEEIIGKFTKNNLQILDMQTLTKYAEGKMPTLTV